MSNKNNYPQSSYKVGYWTFKLYFVAGCKCVFLMCVLTHIWREPLVATRGTVCFCHFALTSLEVTLNNANSANSSYVWTDLSASRFRGSLFLVRHTTHSLTHFLYICPNQVVYNTLFLLTESTHTRVHIGLKIFKFKCYRKCMVKCNKRSSCRKIVWRLGSYSQWRKAVWEVVYCAREAFVMFKTNQSEAEITLHL